MRQVTLKVKRENGNVDIVDVTSKFGMMSKPLFKKIKESTKTAGRGDVIEAVLTLQKSNMSKLVKEYNNLHNEGGEGYIPENGYFQALPEYKSWEEKEIFN